MTQPITILGIDPGLRHTGWGVLISEGNRLKAVASGVISPATTLPTAERLRLIHNGIIDIARTYQPDESALEETFVNANAASTLKLGLARGCAMAALAVAGLSVAEYAANMIKKSVAGFGHADKNQVMTMIKLLLPGLEAPKADAADALAVALCHAHHRLPNAIQKAIA